MTDTPKTRSLTEETTTPTPLPWEQDPVDRFLLMGPGEEVVADVGFCALLTEAEKLANADLIVRAVNSHEALIEALRPFAEYQCYFAESGFAHACIGTPTCQSCAARAALQHAGVTK